MNYYTSVEQPIEVLHKLGNKVKEISVSELKNLKIEPGQTVFVELNDANDSEYREHMLNRHDALIYTSSKDVLTNNKNVIIVYTGKKASFEQPNEKYLRQRRDTKPNEPGQSNNFIMAYTNFSALYANSGSYMIQEKIDYLEPKNNALKNYTLIECKNKELELGANFTHNETQPVFCLKDLETKMVK